MNEIPEELEVLVNILIGMTGTLEQIRDIVYTLEGKISKIEDRIASLENTSEEKDYTSFKYRVSKWLKNTRK
jgi:hypothetical protein